jgi:hypothetical protein
LLELLNLELHLPLILLYVDQLHLLFSLLVLVLSSTLLALLLLFAGSLGTRGGGVCVNGHRWCLLLHTISEQVILGPL